MRIRALLAIVSALVSGVAVVGLQPAGAAHECRSHSAAGADVTDKDHLVVWSVNLKLYERSHEGLHPKCFFDELARIASSGGNKPDIILGQEIGNESYGRFMQLLQARLDAEYSFRHSAEAGPGYNMVVWRKARLRLRSNSNVHRFRSLVPRDGKCRATNSWQIAVRLFDLQQEKSLVASSLHFGAKEDACVHQNTIHAHTEINERWKSIPMLVLGGDFNEKPDNKDDSETGSWRREENPDCWYRLFSESLSDSKNDQACPGTSVSGYFDTVRQANPGDEICAQWSHGQIRIPEDPESCENQKGRIDYIWVRYENANGDAVTTEPAIEVGLSDRGYSEDNDWDGSKYSDHRGVRARLTW